MSIAVSVDQLRDQIEVFGNRPYLVTVSPEQRAHVVSVLARLDGEELVMAAGGTSRANAAANPAVTLLWPPVGDGLYGLIVDGPVRVDDEDVVHVSPSRAVLHRAADAGQDIPKCVPLDQD